MEWLAIENGERREGRMNRRKEEEGYIIIKNSKGIRKKKWGGKKERE